MYRSGGAGLFLIISALATILGLFLMAIEKRWTTIIGILLGYLLIYEIWTVILSIPSTHERLVFAIPFLSFTLPIVIPSGLFVWDAATDPEAFEQRWEKYRTRKIDATKRKKGIYQLLMSFAVWFYWGLHPNLTNGEMAIAVAIWGYLGLFGLQNFFAENEKTTINN